MADYTLSHTAAEVDAALTAAENSAQVSGVLKGAGNGTYTNIPVDNAPVNASTNLITSGAVHTALALKQDVLTFDEEPVEDSSNPVRSGGIFDSMEEMRGLIYDLMPREILPSAAIHAFSDGAEAVPIKEMAIDVVAVQAGSGDPSPSNERPIAGWSVASVVGSGKNMFYNRRSSSATTINGVTFTPQSDGSVIVNGTATANANYTMWNRASDNVHLPSAEYVLTGCPSGGSGTTYLMEAQCTRDGALYGFGNDTGSGLTFTPLYTDAMQITIQIRSGYTANNLRFYPMLRPSSFTDATYTPYNGSIVTIDLGSTIYGGTLTYKSGREWELMVDRAYVELDSSFSGTIDLASGTTQQVIFRAALTGGDSNRPYDVQTNYFKAGATASTAYCARLSFRNPYRDAIVSFPAGTFSDVADFKTNWLSGKSIQFVYFLASPITLVVTADGVVMTKYKENVLYADCGSSSLTYRQDIGLALGG